MNSYLLHDGLKKLFGTTKDHWSRLRGIPRMPEGDNAASERTQTDEGLRKERSRTDQALANRQEVVDGTADLVIHRARETADAVVTAARDMVDEGQDAVTMPPEQRAATTEQRELDDKVIECERAAADEVLRLERVEAVRVLATLLPLEREATDRYLLTERARSDGALARRDGLLGIVAHDLRDLLGGMVLSAEVIASIATRAVSADRVLEETGKLRRYAARMNRLVGDLVDTASIDAGKLSITPTPGDVALLLTEAAETFRAPAAAKGISVEVEAAGPSFTAAFDHGRMLQVLANLLSNSIKFTPSGGRITIRAERTAHELRFCVNDTGPGIPATSLEAIFERFWQAGKNSRTGLGLGLYISRCIVEAHGGKIWAENVPPGEGATICVTLPA